MADGQEPLFGPEFLSPLPDGLTPHSECSDCSDFIWACTIWRKSFPWLEAIYAEETS